MPTGARRRGGLAADRCCIDAVTSVNSETRVKCRRPIARTSESLGGNDQAGPSCTEAARKTYWYILRRDAGRRICHLTERRQYAVSRELACT